MALDSIYSQLITEYSRDKRYRRDLENETCSVHGINPSCGDEITIHLREHDGIIEDASFTGAGCAISQASAAMMSDLLKGATVEDAKRLADLFLGMIKGEITDDDALAELEDALALKGISKMPARVKCAVLPWHTLQDALKTDKTKN